MLHFPLISDIKFTPILRYAQLSAAVYDAEFLCGLHDITGKLIASRSGWNIEEIYNLRGTTYFSVLYKSEVKKAQNFILVFRGTQSNTDWKADAGFSGDEIIPNMSKLPWGFLFDRYRSKAIDDARRAAQKTRGKIILTGHSLGGGLAAISAAHNGLSCVAFNPPAVTAVAGVKYAYNHNKPFILNICVKNDPINETLLIGERIGNTVTIPSPRFGIEAHDINKTVAELSPIGAFTNFGAKNPFEVKNGQYI